MAYACKGTVGVAEGRILTGIKKLDEYFTRSNIGESNMLTYYDYKLKMALAIIKEDLKFAYEEADNVERNKILEKVNEIIYKSFIEANPNDMRYYALEFIVVNAPLIFSQLRMDFQGKSEECKQGAIAYLPTVVFDILDDYKPNKECQLMTYVMNYLSGRIKYKLISEGTMKKETVEEVSLEFLEEQNETEGCKVPEAVTNRVTPESIAYEMSDYEEMLKNYIRNGGNREKMKCLVKQFQNKKDVVGSITGNPKKCADYDLKGELARILHELDGKVHKDFYTFSEFLSINSDKKISFYDVIKTVKDIIHMHGYSDPNKSLELFVKVFIGGEEIKKLAEKLGIKNGQDKYESVRNALFKKYGLDRDSYVKQVAAINRDLNNSPKKKTPEEYSSKDGFSI